MPVHNEFTECPIREVVMPTDYYTPLSTALWDYLSKQGGDPTEIEWEHDRLMTEIETAATEILEGTPKWAY